MEASLKSLATAAGTIRHTVALMIIIATGVVSVTLLYAQVNQTKDKVETNTENIDEIRDSLYRLSIQQGVIIQQIEDEKEDSKEFRSRADRSLDRILDKLNTPNPSGGYTP